MHDALLTTGIEEVWMDKALHDLCQPLTALECQLVLGTMEAERCETAAEAVVALRGAIDEALVQCARTMTQVRSMQERLDR